MSVNVNVDIKFEIKMSTILTDLPESKQYWEMYKIIQEKISEITSTKKGLLDFLHTDDSIADDIRSTLSFAVNMDKECAAESSTEMSLDASA